MMTHEPDEQSEGDDQQGHAERLDNETTRRVKPSADASEGVGWNPRNTVALPSQCDEADANDEAGQSHEEHDGHDNGEVRPLLGESADAGLSVPMLTASGGSPIKKQVKKTRSTPGVKAHSTTAARWSAKPTARKVVVTLCRLIISRRTI